MKTLLRLGDPPAPLALSAESGGVVESGSNRPGGGGHGDVDDDAVVAPSPGGAVVLGVVQVLAEVAGLAGGKQAPFAHAVVLDVVWFQTEVADLPGGAAEEGRGPGGERRSSDVVAVRCGGGKAAEAAVDGGSTSVAVPAAGEASDGHPGLDVEPVPLVERVLLVDFVHAGAGVESVEHPASVGGVPPVAPVAEPSGGVGVGEVVGRRHSEGALG